MFSGNSLSRFLKLMIALAAMMGAMTVWADHDGSGMPDEVTATDPIFGYVDDSDDTLGEGDVIALDPVDGSVVHDVDTGEGDVVTLDPVDDSVVHDVDEEAGDVVTLEPVEGSVVHFNSDEGEVGITMIPLMNISTAGGEGSVMEGVVEQIGAADAAELELNANAENEVLTSTIEVQGEVTSTPAIQGADGAAGGRVRISGGHLTGGATQPGN